MSLRPRCSSRPAQLVARTQEPQPAESLRPLQLFGSPLSSSSSISPSDVSVVWSRRQAVRHFLSHHITKRSSSFGAPFGARRSFDAFDLMTRCIRSGLLTSGVTLRNFVDRLTIAPIEFVQLREIPCLVIQ